MPDDATLVVMSDHGAVPIKKFVHLDQWLIANNWQKRHTQPGQDAGQQRGGLVGLTYDLLKRHLPPRWKRRLKGFTALRSRVESTLAFAHMDWSKTIAYTCNVQGIFLNVRGRQPSGLVEPGAEYESIRDRIADELASLVDPDTGESVVGQVFRKEEIFAGPYLDWAPDLYIQWKDDAYMARFDQAPTNKGVLSAPTPPTMDAILPANMLDVLSGTHKREGILLAKGPAIKAGHQIRGASILDLAPTILYLLGQQIPTEMDGHVLLDMLNQARGQMPPPTYRQEQDYAQPSSNAQPLSSEDQADIEERLRGLGYLG